MSESSEETESASPISDEGDSEKEATEADSPDPDVFEHLEEESRSVPEAGADSADARPEVSSSPDTETANRNRPGVRELREFGSVLWTVLWSTSIALTIAVGASTWKGMEIDAGGQPIVLLPESETTDEDRDRWLASLLQLPSIESGEWISPNSLVQRISSTIPPEMWADLFSEDDAWLPWLLELKPSRPLAADSSLPGQLESFRNDPRFRLTLFNDALLKEQRRTYVRIRRMTFVFAGAVTFWGIAALLFSSPPRRRWTLDASVGAALTLALLGVLGYVMREVGIPLQRRPWMSSFGTGFILAGLIGPMLKGHLTHYIRRRGT